MVNGYGALVQVYYCSSHENVAIDLEYKWGAIPRTPDLGFESVHFEFTMANKEVQDVDSDTKYFKGFWNIVKRNKNPRAFFLFMKWKICQTDVNESHAY